MNRLTFLLFLSLFFLFGCRTNRDLQSLCRDIELKYPHVQHLSNSDFLLKKDVLLIDTRQIKEYNTSHITKALRADDKEDLLKLIHQHQKNSKPIVLYCSVGERSSYFAQWLKLEHNIETYNLKGGLFLWANEGFPLEGGTLVHPFDQSWGRYLNK